MLCFGDVIEGVLRNCYRLVFFVDVSASSAECIQNYPGHAFFSHPFSPYDFIRTNIRPIKRPMKKPISVPIL
jgi:hypothetical protein